MWLFCIKLVFDMNGFPLKHFSMQDGRR